MLYVKNKYTLSYSNVKMPISENMLGALLVKLRSAMIVAVLPSWRHDVGSLRLVTNIKRLIVGLMSVRSVINWEC